MCVLHAVRWVLYIFLRSCPTLRQPQVWALALALHNSVTLKLRTSYATHRVTRGQKNILCAQMHSIVLFCLFPSIHFGHLNRGQVYNNFQESNKYQTVFVEAEILIKKTT